MGGEWMALFDRLKQRLHSEENRNEVNGRTGAIHTDNNRGALANGNQTVHTDPDKKKRVDQLTARENDLFLLLLEGFTLKECAKKLMIKYSTANTHMTGVYKKLGVKTRAELIINYRGSVNS